SSGGNGVPITRVEATREVERLRAGIGSWTPCGGFHCNEIEAVLSLNLKQSNRSGYLRPPIRRSAALCSSILPEATQASIKDCSSSLTHKRAPLGVLRTKS